MSAAARIEAGFLLRKLQQGEKLSLPVSRPMPSIGLRCQELRIGDGPIDWRVFYRIDPDAILVLEGFKKQTQTTPKTVIDRCKHRLAEYDAT